MYRAGIGAGLSGMVTSYVLGLASVYVLSLIVDALAPTFGGQKNSVQAFKAVVYASTASWIAGIGQVWRGFRCWSCWPAASKYLSSISASRRP